MSGLARILLGRDYRVSGSDSTESNITKELTNEGATIFIGHLADNIADADIVVYSAAIRDDNPEMKYAKEQNKKIITRSKLLGLLMSEKKGIAVAGTHGKTTTSTMLSMVLSDAGLDPTMVIGGEVKNIGGNAKDGQGEWFVAEACEYEKSFLDLNPYAAIITNIEEDHLDCYDDLSDIVETFEKFVSQINQEGFLVISIDDANTTHASKEYKGKILTYGINGKTSDICAKNIQVKSGKTYFEINRGEESLGTFTLVVPGVHNVSNALAVIAAAGEIGVGIEIMRKTLAGFTGAKRRFEVKGHKDGVTVIDDYAHHPTEVQATLAGLKSYYPGHRVLCVFQPHQYSRTKYLLADFAKSFSDADEVIIPDIYEARDTKEDKKAVSSEILVDEINIVSHNAKYIGEFGKITKYLCKNVKSGDVVITVGAGPVYKVGEAYLSG